MVDCFNVRNTKALKLYNYSNNADQVSADGYTGKTLEQYARFIRDNRGYRENFLLLQHLRSLQNFLLKSMQPTCVG